MFIFVYIIILQYRTINSPFVSDLNVLITSNCYFLNFLLNSIYSKTQQAKTRTPTQNDLNKSVISNNGDLTLNESSIVKTPLTNRLLASKANKLNTPPYGQQQMTPNDNLCGKKMK